MDEYLIQIPVKKNSERIPNKSIRSFGGKTLLNIAIEKALKVLPPKQIFLNSNCEESISIANTYKISIHKRKDELCCNSTTLDTFTYDFMSLHQSKNVILVNPVNPLMTVSTLNKMIKYYESYSIDSLVTGNDLNLHSFMNGDPVNFKNVGPIPPTQNIHTISTCNWGFAIWNSNHFIANYEKSQRAVFCDNFKIFNTPLIESIKISTLDDFSTAETLFLSLNN